MAEDADNESKTEDPTGKRLGDARDKGQVASSREVGTALLLLGATGVFFFHGETLWNAFQEKMRFFLSGAISDDLTHHGLSVLLDGVLIGMLIDLAPFMLVLVFMAIFGSLIQHGFLFSWEPLMPKFSKINPWSGLKRLFSKRSLVDLFKSILKMGVISLVVYYSIKGSMEEILGWSATSIEQITFALGKESLSVLWKVSLAFLAFALFDFMYQRYEHMKSLRMTKQEVKDELKQMEGDPLVKSRIRQIQREMAQRRMMAEVPKADVVITNPTHVAVALLYQQGKMAAPKVIAKGRGHVAERIREMARGHRVPIVENPPLARSLFKDVDLDRVIPHDLFKAVAEVLAYVYGLRGMRR
ncbi:Flagellar biosynthetic protein FlhB [Candidatus Magnetaquicoccaceae bacterium FCR-1]|uniref:Flagellar biosynthetic protein FlhB n=1 Tax=Candidatus Magnetaquiglobus chichijimensis TaxID=3141448 RepID=A0ABQ0CD80_9PROT